MLECTQTVTLMHHVKGDDGDTYVCTTHSGASWFSHRAITSSGDGAKPSHSYEVRLMTTADITVDEGDFVILGAHTGLTTPATLKGLQHFRINRIGDNRRGMLAHWRLSGA